MITRIYFIIALLCTSFAALAQNGETTYTIDEAPPVYTTATDSLPYTPAVPWGDDLRSRLSALLDDAMFETSQLGLCVYDLTGDSLLFARGERQSMRPASTQKVLTAIAALQTLGGSHRFETALYRDGDVSEDSTLNGDLYVVGGMDPMFGYDDMRAFVRELLDKGIRRITGSLYADVTMKDTLKWGWGWCWDDDAPELRALLYNGKAGFMEVFVREAAASGITLPSAYSLRKVPGLAALIASRFHSMDQILLPMLKNSNNLYAEAMFYQLGARRGNYPDYKASAEAVSAMLRSIGAPDGYLVADGSGLSLYNYTSARTLVAALRHAHRYRDTFEHLYYALPIAATDGTLEQRMRGTKADYNVRAKTGTVEGVSSLAGYATAPNGNLIAFAIINQGIRRTATGRNFQNRVCIELCR